MIEWNGGKMPVDGTTAVLFQLRDGTEGMAQAGCLRWLHAEWGTPQATRDLVAYKVAPAVEPVAPAPQLQPPKAAEILRAALGHMEDRAATYDAPSGERSVPAVVAAFAAVTGVELTPEQGWLFLVLLKAVRSQQGDYRADNYEDLAAYAGLMGEAAACSR